MATKPKSTRSRSVRKKPGPKVLAAGVSNRSGSGRGVRQSSGARTRSANRAGSLVTVDHDEIRGWAEERGGVPATVKGTQRGRGPGVIRIDFPDGPEPKLEQISWDDWFDKFDENELAFLYQDKTASGKLSRFNKLVKRETIQGTKRPTRTAAKTRAAGARSAA